MATLPYVVTMDECVFCGEDSVQGDALCEDPRCRERVATCGGCGKTFPDIYPSARCPYEYDHEYDYEEEDEEG